MTVPKMCIYDKDHFISSYKTANAVNNLAKIKKNKALFLFPIGTWKENCNHLLRIQYLSLFTHITLIFRQPICTNRQAMQCGATPDGQVMVERSYRMRSTGEGNGKPLQYSCLENHMNSIKMQNDRIVKEEFPRSMFPICYRRSVEK